MDANRNSASGRNSERNSLLLQASLAIVDGPGPYPVLVRNLSTGGMMVEGFPGLAVGMAVMAEIGGIGQVGGTIAWTESGRAGVSFVGPIDPARAKVKLEAAPRPPYELPVAKTARRPGLKLG